LHVFLDESGDTGWDFSQPYRKGGSSRFLTLAFLVVDPAQHDRPRRLIRDIRRKYRMNVSREIKGCELSPGQLLFFATRASTIIAQTKGISLRAITVMKENVQDHIRGDPNKLYNYMANLCLLDAIKHEAGVNITPDPRSIKVASGDSMIDYLQTQLWFDRSAETVLVHRPFESHRNLNLQFVDVVAHIVWSHYEDNDNAAYSILSPYVQCKHLFFK
jgi:hypothetical protein